jgi:hypothetical protein
MVPQFLLEENMEPILCTQPRRFAVVAIAQMIAESRNCQVGEEVGYHIGHSNVSNLNSKRWFLCDPWLVSFHNNLNKDTSNERAETHLICIYTTAVKILPLIVICIYTSTVKMISLIVIELQWQDIDLIGTVFADIRQLDFFYKFCWSQLKLLCMIPFVAKDIEHIERLSSCSI